MRRVYRFFDIFLCTYHIIPLWLFNLHASSYSIILWIVGWWNKNWSRNCQKKENTTIDQFTVELNDLLLKSTIWEESTYAIWYDMIHVFSATQVCRAQVLCRYDKRFIILQFSRILLSSCWFNRFFLEKFKSKVYSVWQCLHYRTVQGLQILNQPHNTHGQRWCVTCGSIILCIIPLWLVKWYIPIPILTSHSHSYWLLAWYIQRTQ